MAIDDKIDDPNRVLRLLIEHQNRNAKKKTRGNGVLATSANTGPELIGNRENLLADDEENQAANADEENLMKIIAKRSQGIAITESNLGLDSTDSVDTADDSPSQLLPPDSVPPTASRPTTAINHQLPGAYSAGGQDGKYARVSKAPLSSHASLSSDDLGEDISHSSEDSKSPLREKRGRKIVLLLGALVMVILVIVLPPVLLLGGDEEIEAGGTQGYEEIQDSKSLDASLLPNLTASTIHALEDPHSIQYRSYDWLARDPNWQTYEPWRLQQRFAMACLWYSFGVKHGFLRRVNVRTHECDWDPHFDFCPKDDGRITALGIRSNQWGKIKANKFISGQFPPEMALLSNLEVIDFGHAVSWVMPLEGMLPHQTTANLPFLRELRLFGSNLKGTIPSSFGLLSSLEHLDLSDNELHGTIPSELGILSNLHALVMSTNSLSGAIPKELGELTSLTNFKIEKNDNVDSVVPSELCHEDHFSVEVFTTEWCQSIYECCNS